MKYTLKPKEQHKKRGPTPSSEPGKSFRAFLKPSVKEKIINRYGTLTLALLAQYELDNKKDEQMVK